MEVSNEIESSSSQPVNANYGTASSTVYKPMEQYDGAATKTNETKDMISNNRGIGREGMTLSYFYNKGGC